MIRDTLGTPIKINCALRCPSHNKSTGGADNSFHIQGMAADIAVKDINSDKDIPSELLYDAIKLIQIPAVIMYPGHFFCHIDVRKTSYPVRLKKSGGFYIPVEY